MAYKNNIYGNAAYVGFLEGMLLQRSTIKSETALDYAAIKDSALAMAADVDTLINFDSLVTTGSAITQLAITTNVIAANEQWRAGLLQALCAAAVQNGYTEDAVIAGEQTDRAAAIVAAWTELVAGLVTP